MKPIVSALIALPVPGGIAAPASALASPSSPERPFGGPPPAQSALDRDLQDALKRVPLRRLPSLIAPLS
jgi:hypothetical protein